ncbi:hypothetical protein SI65_02784 [Aspergillus cristatus]|uniref:AB hydrolase-1 domain-containing protein n=1 Tax=Aspergillus cristatus TaxID=573508 RepID=A0A1E3BLV4_ASPCR|nr:hypothetical protein SI65_02784 [Aspergillus cristatus]
MVFLAERGYRVIAHDRRGHGRSTQTWYGNNMDAFVDDLEELFEHLNVQDAMMVGHSHGGGEVTRFLGKHGTSRVKKAVLVCAVPPLMLKTTANAEGTDKSVFDSFRQAMHKDCAQFFLDVPSGPFFGFNRSGAQKSEDQIRSWWQQGMDSSFKTTYDCIKDFSETDFTEDLNGLTFLFLSSMATMTRLFLSRLPGSNQRSSCLKGSSKFTGEALMQSTISTLAK